MVKTIPLKYNACKVCKFANLDSASLDTGHPICSLGKTIPNDYSHAERLARKGGIMAICHFSHFRETMLKRLARDCIGARPLPN